MANKKLPRYFNLMDYVESALWDLLSVYHNPELKSFCELNNIVNLAIETRVVSDDGRGGRWRDDLFELAVKFDKKVGQVAPLETRDHRWLERWLGAVLIAERTDQYDGGGGYVYYSMHYPTGECRKEMDPKSPFGPRWTGSEWKQ